LYERALGARPEFADPRGNLSLIALREQDFARGWDGHEHRFYLDGGSGEPARFGLPRLRAEDLAKARRVAVWKEHGVGDQILFSTLLPEFVERGIEAVVETDERLVEIYQRSLPELCFVTPEGMEAAARDCDCQVPLASLGGFFRRNLGSFARQPRSLLRPDLERVHAVRAELPGRALGISWRTFQSVRRRYLQQRKSIPLERFGVFDHPAVTLVDLQYGDVAAEREAFDARYPGLRHDPAGIDRFSDLEGLIAAIAACDIIVTGSNVTAHLAGAIGKRTWLAYLGANAPFHYWVPGSDGRSIWYPSVEIVTRAEWTDWLPLFEHLRARFVRELPA
jgi:hypothetical protein